MRVRSRRHVAQAVRQRQSIDDFAADTERGQRYTRVFRATLVMLMVLTVGTLGYYHLTEGGYSLIDCLYMTVITVSTVGYQEVVDTHGQGLRIFTMILILFGGGSILYFLSSITAIVVEGDIVHRLYRQRMAAQLLRVRRHVIVAGLGRTGQRALAELRDAGVRVVIIDDDFQRIEEALREFGQDLLFLYGDALDEATLVAARIDRALGLVATLSEDPENLFLCITARQLAPELRIVSRVENANHVHKFAKVGATDAISSARMGGRRLVHELVRPGLLAFTDAMLASDAGALALAEIPIVEGSRVADQALGTARLREATGCLVMGLRLFADEPFRYHPGRDSVLAPGGAVMALGTRRQLRRLRRLLAGPGAAAWLSRAVTRQVERRREPADGADFGGAGGGATVADGAGGGGTDVS